MSSDRTSSPHNAYDASFFDRTDSDATRSAHVILPIVFDWTGRPESVVDVGCGTGAWLERCNQLGVRRIRGFDGAYVDRDRLKIPRDAFTAMDLAHPRPCLDRFDLAISLEVAEHLPATAADRFIAFLTSLSDCVLFSAAVPGQGGVDHINEQPPSYWRDKFAKRGFLMLDPIRPRIWYDSTVARFYSQNTFLYIRSTLAESDPRLMFEHQRARQQRLTVIYDEIAFGHDTVPVAFRKFLRAVARSIRQRLRRGVQRCS